MSTSAAQIVQWYSERRDRRAPELRMAEEIRKAYNGDIVLPLPELGRGEKAAVANLAKLAINQNAMRIGSTLPNLWCPPTRPGIKKSEAEADVRRRTFAGWWEMNDWKKKQYRRARHYVAYASSPVILRPDFDRGIPQWQVLDPLCTYPAPSSDVDSMEPCDIIFSFRRSYGWILYNYPGKAIGLQGADARRPDDMFDLVEFANESEHVLVVLGKQAETSSLWTPTEFGGSSYKGDRYAELMRVENKAGICPAVVPGRVTLDRPQGQFDGMLPLFIKRARLAALEEIAIEKGVFENEWFVQEAPDGDIITEADGRAGIVGHVKGGKLEWHSLNPGYKTDSALDRLERQERVEGTVPAEFAGESASNVRTDRRGNTILSATIDFSIAETHDLESYRKEFARAAAIAKGYFGDKAKSFYVSWKGASGPVAYTPNRVFADSDQVFVRWSMPGSDVNSLTVGGGQRVGMGTLSKRGFMELDPLVDDVEEELDRISSEQIDNLWPVVLQQDLASGLLTGVDFARMQELVASNKLERWEAYQQVHEQAQARQAQAAQAPAGSPGSMPGVTQPGETGPAPIAPSPDEQGLSALMSSLRGPGRVGPLERGTAAA